MALSDTDRSRVATLSPREASGGRASKGRSRSRRFWLLVLLAATVLAVLDAVLGHDDVVKPGGARLVADFFAAGAHPRVDPAFLALTGNAALTTLAYAVLGTALSLVIGLVGGVLGSQVWWRPDRPGRAAPGRRIGWAATRIALVLPRGIHEVVWGLILLSVLGIEPIVAVLAIGIPFGAVTAKVFSEILDEVAETSGSAYAALVTAGTGRRVAFLYGLFPAALSDLISYGFYRLECAIRSAAILGLLGVGGLGYQLLLSFQSLRYAEIWTLLYALIALCALADFWSWLVRSRRSSAYSSTSRRRITVGSLALVGALVPVSVWWVGLSAAPLWDGRTWTLVGRLAAGAWPPSAGPDGWGGLLSQSVATLAMSMVAIAMAFTAGVLLAFPAANRFRGGNRRRRGPRLVVAVLARGLLLLLRAIPPPIWALLFLFVLFPGILPAALALSAYTTGVLGRLMAEATENLDDRPLRALRAHGASGVRVFCYGVVPSATPRFIAYGLYRWEVTIRETVVVGVAGAGGLGLVLNQRLAAFDYAGAAGALLAVLALTALVDFLSAAIRRSSRG